MDAIKISVNGNIAKITDKPEKIVAGTAGLPVEFTFDSTWDNMVKVAVFQAGRIRTNRPIIGDKSVVPVNALAIPGPRLYVGVYGEDENGIKRPTVWANAGQICAGATPGNCTGYDPASAKKYYDQAMLAAERAENAAKQAIEAAESVDTTYFGAPYESASEIITIGDTNPVTMYLFGTTDGYDAVVTGDGAIPDYTEDNRPYDAEKISRLHIEKGITEIGDYFMYGAHNLKQLSFEDSEQVTKLGEHSFAMTQIRGTYNFPNVAGSFVGVFRGCRKLEGVTFGEKVASVSAEAFKLCTDLCYVDGIDSVTNIGDSAFHRCTSLSRIGVNAENTKNITLGNFAFMLTPNEVKVGNTDTNMVDAEWKSKGKGCFVQDFWEEGQLSALREYKPESIRPYPIPETDSQNADLYKEWGVFWGITDGWKGKTPAFGQCGLFSLFHIYNILHPNTQYNTYYDFITKKIAPQKIVVTQALHDALFQSEVWADLVALNEQYATNVTYAVDTEISVTDLPIALDYKSETYGEVSTAFWGICEVLGWNASEVLFSTGNDSGKNVKEIVLNNIAEGKPVVMEIAHSSAEDMYLHGGHAVVPIGYDHGTDKLLVLDSANAAPTDDIPLVYWLPFEALITPSQYSAVWTFEFGEEITMYSINEDLKELMQRVSFRRESGTSWNYIPATESADARVSVPCSPNPRLLIFQATDATAAAAAAAVIKEADANSPYTFAAVLQNIRDLDNTSIAHTNQKNSMGLRYVYYYGYAVPDADAIAFENVDTVPRFVTPRFLTEYQNAAGETVPAEYKWTAYYWDE